MLMGYFLYRLGEGTKFSRYCKLVRILVSAVVVIAIMFCDTVVGGGMWICTVEAPQSRYQQPFSVG
jgi:hypothetical protein